MRSAPPGPPMKLGNMRSLGVRSLAVTCELCHHEAVLPADRWPDAVFVCPRRVSDPVHKLKQTVGPILVKEGGSRPKKEDAMTIHPKLASSKKIIFAILATAFALASVTAATALDRKSAARAKSRSSAVATSPKKPDSAEDRLNRIMNICRCSDIPKLDFGQFR